MSGVFVTVEGCDGSGKSAVVARSVDLLRAQGINAGVCNRFAPACTGPYKSMILAVADLFAAAGNQPVPQEALATAAATQYRLMFEEDALPRMRKGEIVLADSWWGKTWARLCVEASCLGYPASAVQSLIEWMPQLLRLPCDQVPVLQVLVQATKSDRVTWYSKVNTHDRDVVFDDRGQKSVDPVVFGEFTERIENLLIDHYRYSKGTIIKNGSGRSIDSVARDLTVAVVDSATG